MRFLQQFCYLGQRAVSGTDPLFVETSFRSVQSGSVDCTVPTVRTQPAMCVADCLWILLPEGGAIMKQVGDRIGRCAPSCCLCRRSRVGAAAAEPALFAGSNLVHFQTKMAPIKGAILRLVAGACYENYMQIDLDPFPLVT